MFFAMRLLFAEVSDIKISSTVAVNAKLAFFLFVACGINELQLLLTCAHASNLSVLTDDR